MLSPSPEVIKELDDRLLGLAIFLENNEGTLAQATCQERYALLPDTARLALKKVVPVKESPIGKKGDGPKKLLQTASVEPLASIRGRIERWTQDYELFFQERAPGPRTDCYGFLATYVRIGQNEEIHWVSIIQRRFDLESIYLRAVAQGYHTGTAWCNRGSTGLARQLKQISSLSDDLEVIEKNLKTYVQLGRGFHLWATYLGGSGYFILLPLAVAEGK